jgi:hypothetical protein
MLQNRTCIKKIQIRIKVVGWIHFYRIFLGGVYPVHAMLDNVVTLKVKEVGMFQFSWARLAEDMLAVGEDYQLGPAAIFGGNSMGSATALYAALVQVGHQQKTPYLIVLVRIVTKIILMAL